MQKYRQNWKIGRHKKINFKGKSCLKCKRKFHYENKKQSKVIQCTSCKGFVQENTSSGCKVDLSRGNVIYKCTECTVERPQQEEKEDEEDVEVEEGEQSGHMTEYNVERPQEFQPVTDRLRFWLNRLESSDDSKDKVHSLRSLMYLTSKTSPNDVHTVDGYKIIEKYLKIPGNIGARATILWKLWKSEDQVDKRQDEVVMDDIQTSEFQVEETDIVEHEVDIVTTCCKPCSLKVSDECKICKYCKDKPKYGGQNRLKQKCVTKICIKKRKKIWELPL